MKTVFDKIYEAGVVPVIKISRVEDAVPLAEALKKGGLSVLEVTFRTSCAAEAIAAIKKSVKGVTLIAGTVLNAETAKKAADAGAEAIVAPGLNPATVKWCVDNKMPVCPGVSTAGEIEQAMGFGLNFVKFFPAETAGGLKMIKALAAPYSEMRFMPTGGIDENNLLDYLSFDKVVACGGSWMVKEDLIKAGSFAEIERLARSAARKAVGVHLAHVGINCGNEAEAAAAAKMFALALGCDIKDGNSSAFIGSSIELMKSPYLGKNGHIAIGVNNFTRGKAWLERLGFEFDECTLKKDANGKSIAVYIKNEIAGFAVHIVERK